MIIDRIDRIILNEKPNSIGAQLISDRIRRIKFNRSVKFRILRLLTFIK